MEFTLGVAQLTPSVNPKCHHWGPKNQGIVFTVTTCGQRCGWCGYCEVDAPLRAVPGAPRETLPGIIAAPQVGYFVPLMHMCQPVASLNR